MFGVYLTLLIGPTIAVPVPPPLLDSLESIEVEHDDKKRSGFTVTFQLGRGGPLDIVDYSHFLNPLLGLGNRVIIIVTMNAIPRVIMDGIIQNRQFSPSSDPGESKLVLTGEDVSCKMDTKDVKMEHPAQPELIIANKLILMYAEYGLIPQVIPPISLDIPIPLERIPVQACSDLKYLEWMAQKFGYVFYITPGPLPFTNTAYWGPPVRIGIPQKALTVGMGPETNVESISFQHDARKAKRVSAKIQDRNLNESIPVESFVSTRVPLALFPELLVNFTNTRVEELECSEGLNTMQAYSQAQAVTDESTDDILKGTGQIDTIRYGNILMPRGLVGIRGVGYMHDGLYYVQNVSHKISKESYKQSFTISREGLGSTTPVV